MTSHATEQTAADLTKSTDSPTEISNDPLTQPSNNDHGTAEQFHFFEIDPNERLTRPPAPNADCLSQAEQLVSWAVSSKHENSLTLHNNESTDKNPAIEAAKCHSLLINLLTRKSDPSLLHAALHALLISNHGRELDRLVTDSKLHAQLIHLIMRLDPFVPGVDMCASLRELEAVRRQRSQLATVKTNATKEAPAKKGVHIAESSIVYKENTKYILPTMPFFRYDIADVHLYLIVALVSNNSLLGVSAVRAVWKLLTDFGSKWMNEQDEKRRQNIASEKKQSEDDKTSSPLAKRMKCDEGSTDDAHVASDAEKVEGPQLAPGMNGLSVEFVKETFYSDNRIEFDEGICSDQLSRGRVKRLLLVLVNIFRLNHRSKNDLLHEISIHFPHYKTSPSAFHRWYINMCLQIVHLVPTLEGPIINLLVDQALEMDVHIKINDKGGVFLDEEDLENVTNEVSTKKRSYKIISQDTLSAGKTNNTSDSPAEDSDEISEIAERLDNLMNILCQRIHKLTSFSSDSVSEALAAVVDARRLYRHLDEVFDKKVRTTHRSKFVPFIFFVLFGREHDALEAVGRLMSDRKNGATLNVPGGEDMMQGEKGTEIDSIISASISQTDFLYRGFCAKLIDLFYNPVDAGEMPLQTIVCCLASFVSRATYVCPETVCETVAAILQWVEAYIEAHTESQGTSALIRRQSSGLGNTLNQRDIHALFYTACQSIFYIMCFRGAEALHYYHAAWRHRDDPESQYASPESVNLGPKRWKAICKHPLQPLTYCLESVRVEFLHVAEDLDLFVEELAAEDLESQETEAKHFIESLWSTNDQGKPNGDKSKTIAPKRKRSSIISTAATQEKKRLDGGIGGLGQGSNPLDSYFPFDPYLLQSSYKHVHPYYRNWEDCILTMEELDDATITEAVDESALIQDITPDTDNEDEDDALTDSGDEIEEDDDDDESDDDESNGNPETKKSKSLEGNGLDEEIRRCRAMSTGSQASW